MNIFPGLRVGHATDAALKSGVTVFLPDEPAIAAVQVTGAAPATRETDLLRPGNTVERVDAITLSGGSAYGPSATGGVMEWLTARGRGFAIGGIHVPIVPGASVFDLANGGDKSNLGSQAYYALGAEACEAADDQLAIGSVGAGAGATTADLKGGFGMAEATLSDGARVAAFVAANAVGRVTLGSTPHFRAAPFEQGDEFGGFGLPSPLPADAGAIVTKLAEPIANTTIALVATDRILTRAEAKRFAITAHDGIALAIYPAHTPFDGDTVFALSTGLRPPSDDRAALLELCAAAAAALARAIARAIYAAEPAPGDPVPTWRERYDTGA